MTTKRRRWALAAALLGLAVGALVLATVYTNWKWFHSLDLESVYWRAMRARLFAGAFFGLVAALLIAPNLLLARRFTRELLAAGSPWGPEGSPLESLLRSRTAYLVAGGILVLLMARIGSGQWLLWLRFFHDQPFGLADPIFSRDIGFYVFELPFLRFLSGYLLGCVILSFVAVCVVYIAGGGIRLPGERSPRCRVPGRICRSWRACSCSSSPGSTGSRSTVCCTPTTGWRSGPGTSTPMSRYGSTGCSS